MIGIVVVDVSDKIPQYHFNGLNREACKHWLLKVREHGYAGTWQERQASPPGCIYLGNGSRFLIFFFFFSENVEG